MLYVDHRRYTGVLRRRASDLLCFNLLRKALEGLQGRMEYRKVHRGVVRRLEAIMEVGLVGGHFRTCFVSSSLQPKIPPYRLI